MSDVDVLGNVVRPSGPMTTTQHEVACDSTAHEGVGCAGAHVTCMENGRHRRVVVQHQTGKSDAMILCGRCTLRVAIIIMEMELG
jgi:hypothetical protein